MGHSRRYENSLAAILFFTWGTVFLGRMSAFYLAPYFAPEFHLSHGQVGTVASVLAITWAVSTFVFGALSDRVGRKPVLVPAVFAFSILSWASGLAHNFHQLLLVRALMGVAGGPTWSTMTALIEESSPSDRRGRNIGLVVSAAALVGLAAAPVLTTQVAARWGWRPAFFVAGAPGLLMSVLVWKFVQEPVARIGIHEKPSLSEYFSILRYRNIWLCCLGAAGFMSWLFAVNVFAPLYITEVVHESATTAGFLLGASGLGSFFLGFLLPSLSDRWGRKPTLLLMAAMSAVVPLAFLVPALYVYPVGAGVDRLCSQFRAGHSQRCPGSGAHRKCSGSVPRHVHRPCNASRRGHGCDGRAYSGGHAGPKTRSRRDDVASCGWERIAISGRTFSSRDRTRCDAGDQTIDWSEQAGTAEGWGLGRNFTGIFTGSNRTPAALCNSCNLNRCNVPVAVLGSSGK
jgi:predicted MFS family arabinose efflux permease